MRPRPRPVLVAALVALSVVAGARAVAAAPTEDETLFASAVERLHEGKPGEAIADFEALADHGVVDATVSFDRGLAYIGRVRVGAEQPGDLGQAVHGLVEARTLAADRSLTAEATRAIGLVRAEVGRRRVRAGEPVEFDPGMALGPAFLRLLPEDGWAIAGILGSIVLGVSLFVWRSARERRARIAAIVTAGVGGLLLVLGTTSTFATQQQRLTVTPGVIVTAGAHPTDDRGLVVAGAPVIPEAADVEILGHRAGWAQVRWGKVVAWIPAGAARAVAQ
jgi:hypothetical protein